jgi:aryl-alcohol dehydrogenase-like predicted oxidoreductase
MLTRTLGPAGPELPALGVGAMSFTDFYGPASREGSFAILDAARDAGVRLVDTANIYGMGLSEETIGAYLARRGGPCPFHIATKAGIRRDPETGARGFDNTPEHLEAELDRSLRRLGLERVDLFYVHRRDPRLEIEEVTEFLASLIAKGKIGSFGFSEIAPASLRRAARVHPVAAVQSEYSLQCRAPELGLVQACEALGTALVAFSPVGRGLLTDRPPTPERVADSAFLRENPRFAGAALGRNIAASDPLRALAREQGVASAALAIAWLLAQSPAVFVIPGTRNPAHFAELLDGARMTPAPELLAEIARRLPPGWCEGARYAPAQAAGPEEYC